MKYRNHNWVLTFDLNRLISAQSHLTSNHLARVKNPLRVVVKKNLANYSHGFLWLKHKF